MVLLLCTRRSRFQRVRVQGLVADNAWRIQFPNGLVAAFSGSVDASILRTVLTTAAAVD